MALFLKEGLLTGRWAPRLESVRFNRRVNVQRPRAPHYERARLLALLEPQYKKDDSALFLPPSMKCKKNEELQYYKSRPDNPLERILAKELYDRCESSKMVCFIHTNPITGEDQFQARIFLRREKMDIERYSRYTAALAFKNTKYEAVLPLLVVHNAFIFSEEPNVDKLFSVLKKVPQYVLMAGIIDNSLLSVSQLKRYSELKDITTARAQLVGVLNSFGQHTVSQLMAHPQRLLSQLQHLASSSQEEEKS